MSIVPRPPVAGGGGGGEITEVSEFGSDIALVNGWTVPPVDDFDSPARIYKQGGRAWLAGYFIGGNDSKICNLPSAYDAEFFGSTGNDARIYLSGNVNGAPVSIIVAPRSGGGGYELQATGANLNDYLSADGLSWPLAIA